MKKLQLIFIAISFDLLAMDELGYNGKDLCEVPIAEKVAKCICVKSNYIHTMAHCARSLVHDNGEENTYADAIRYLAINWPEHSEAGIGMLWSRNFGTKKALYKALADLVRDKSNYRESFRRLFILYKKDAWSLGYFLINFMRTDNYSNEDIQRANDWINEAKIAIIQQSLPEKEHKQLKAFLKNPIDLEGEIITIGIPKLMLMLAEDENRDQFIPMMESIISCIQLDIGYMVAFAARSNSSRDLDLHGGAIKWLAVSFGNSKTYAESIHWLALHMRNAVGLRGVTLLTAGEFGGSRALSRAQEKLIHGNDDTDAKNAAIKWLEDNFADVKIDNKRTFEEITISNNNKSKNFKKIKI